MSGLNIHRVMRVNDRSYAVTDPEGNFASGRAEQDILVSGNVGSQNQHFLKKIIIEYHAAAGEAGVHRVKRPV
jgi:hypothetical protein